MFKTLVKAAGTAVVALGMAAAAHAAQLHNGEVVETMNAGGYTYVQIKEEGKLVWAAAPETKVKKGDKVEFDEQMNLPSFESKTLKRTFSPIIFAGKIVVK
ncbi:NrfJ [Ferrimonas sediminicola]|uniref:NrfJ n=1 Tax=Ferrimonas sediminicola TaxID=2569538 RepID=A0A4U1BCS5_9GAMM|nr:NrfJ [Ferrimonas sediminicola]TKB48315.1 NrfJ [Ferrimonas sediminicola]